MDALSVVVGALNTGFLATLKLFLVTLVGALPLGLVVAFGSMNRWAPFAGLAHRYLRRRDRKPGRIARLLIAFMPIRLVCRLVVWVIRGTPLMLQLLIIFYIPGYVLEGGSPWPSGETGRFLAAGAWGTAIFDGEKYKVVRREAVDEAALIEALKAHKIQGAALDVVETNLPADDNPLLKMDNVIVTPHTAAFTTEALENMAYQAALGVYETLEGKPVTFPINKLGR